MPKKQPPLADWLVTFLDPRAGSHSLKIRATYLEVHGTALYLLDTARAVLYFAPAGAVHVRRLESGEEPEPAPPVAEKAPAGRRRRPEPGA